jgi:hypothetical protein
LQGSSQRVQELTLSVQCFFVAYSWQFSFGADAYRFVDPWLVTSGPQANRDGNHGSHQSGTPNHSGLEE